MRKWSRHCLQAETAASITQPTRDCSSTSSQLADWSGEYSSALFPTLLGDSPARERGAVA